MVKVQKKFPPVIKWSGSKRNIACNISKFIPDSNRYFEPFLGGGALLPFRKIEQGFASDIIPELIALWTEIKTEPEIVSAEYKKRWNKLQKKGYNVFYEVRENFNNTRDIHDFLFLTRTCVNGLIRYNTKGDFNNSFHLTRPGINPDSLKEIIYQWHFIIKDMCFYNCDYRELTASAKKGDFVFFDPPYGGTKGRYTQNPFDIESFFNELSRLSNKGVKWILTFDGQAGNRNYKYELPSDLYSHKVNMKTGHSPFTKLMNTTIDDVNESVYLNFEPISKFPTTVFDNISNELALFST